MTALLKTTIGDIVAGNEHAAQLFELLGIDYACHGNLTLRDACAAVGLDSTTIRRSIDQLPRSEQASWIDQPLPALLTYVRDQNDPAVLRSMEETARILTLRCGPCATQRAELDRIAEAFATLREALQAHVSREEHVLLPVVEHLDTCWRRNEKPSMRLAGGVGPAIAALVNEHHNVVRLLAPIHETTMVLSSREDRCGDLLRTLHDLDHNVRLHIHLQNNILFPRSAALECVIDDPSKPRLTQQR